MAASTLKPAPARVLAGRERGLLAMLVGLGLLLRLPTLDVQSFWVDEAFTVDLLRGGLAELGNTESTPPLYYALAWVWSQVAGDGEFGLRVLSALLGAATVPAVFAAGAALGSRRVGLAAAALATVNPLLVWYSQEARAYALLLVLGTLSFAFFARALHEPRTRVLAGWAAASALALLTHYFAVFLVFPEAFWLLARHRRKGVVGAIAVPALAGVAVLPLALHQRSQGLTPWTEVGSVAGRLVEVARNFVVGWEWTPFTGRVAAPVLAALAVAATTLLVARGTGEERRRLVPAAAIAGAAAIGPLLLALVGTNYLNSRNLLCAWTPVALVVAGGLCVRAAPRAGAALGALLCLGSLAVVVAVPLHPGLQRDAWREVAEAIGPAPAARVVAVRPDSELRAGRLYVPRSTALPGAGVLTDELVVIGRASVRPEPPPSLPGGLRLVERRDVRNLEVASYRAPAPVRLTPAWVPGPSRALLQLPR
ncbi:MAG: glycosyltransferase family 39 protein [Thermoleophilaceae bacterium]|nr:glycosyltransferase family 39 protein [Thermoleophilaceae bacterium]